MATRLTYRQRIECQTLYHHAGWSYNQIHERLQIPRSTVRLAVTTLTTPPRPAGRQPVCRTSTRKRLVKRATADAYHRRLPLEEIAQIEGVDACRRTLISAFRKEGFSRRKARSKPLLTEKQKATRLEFALAYINWTQEQWDRVLWTDEASIKVGWFGQIYITRTVGEEFEEACLVPKFRKYSSCMIWGIISSRRVYDIHIFDAGSINAARYCDECLSLLNTTRCDYIIENDGDEPIFMQDNAKIHKARITMDLLRQLRLEILDWPANSPDLNPIENIWSILKRRIGAYFPKTREEVEKAVREEWPKLTSDDVGPCTSNMRERLQAVIDAEGGHTRW